MTAKRTYGDSCGIARALDLVGERWALLVVRELLLGPKRFTDLREGLPHVSPGCARTTAARAGDGGRRAPAQAAAAGRRAGLRADRVGIGARAGAGLAGALGQPGDAPGGPAS